MVAETLDKPTTEAKPAETGGQGGTESDLPEDVKLFFAEPETEAAPDTESEKGKVQNSDTEKQDAIEAEAERLALELAEKKAAEAESTRKAEEKKANERARERAAVQDFQSRVPLVEQCIQGLATGQWGLDSIVQGTNMTVAEWLPAQFRNHHGQSSLAFWDSVKSDLAEDIPEGEARDAFLEAAAPRTQADRRALIESYRDAVVGNGRSGFVPEDKHKAEVKAAEKKAVLAYRDSFLKDKDGNPLTLDQFEAKVATLRSQLSAPRDLPSFTANGGSGLSKEDALTLPVSELVKRGF